MGNLGKELRPTDSASAVPPKKKKKKKNGRKAAYGIIGGCTVILIVAGVIAYFALRSISERASEELESALENADNSEWQQVWKDFTTQMEEEMGEAERDIEEVEGGVGDNLSDGKISISLNSERKEDRIGSMPAREGYEFVILNVDLTNQADEEIIFYTSDFHLRDSIFTEYGQVVPSDDSGLDLFKTMQNILPGKKTGGDIVFEVKREATGLELIYIGDKKIIFEINNN